MSESEVDPDDTADVERPSPPASRRRLLGVAAVTAGITGVALVAAGGSTWFGSTPAAEGLLVPPPPTAADAPVEPTTTTAAASTLPATPTPDSTSPERKARKARKAKRAATTAATTAPTTTLPTPIAPPDPDGYEETVWLGEMEIPALGLTAPLLEGIRLITLDQGPGHWPGSAMPGEVGNVVVAGHRVSNGGVFRYIDTLVEGDELVFRTESGRHTYRVTSTEIVGPEALWIVDPTPTPTATLFACHPPGSVSQRIVVKAELVT